MMNKLNLLKSSLRTLTTFSSLIREQSIAALRTTSRPLLPSPHFEPRPSEVLLRSFSTRAPQKFHRVNIEPSLDVSVVVDNGQRYYAYGMLNYKIIDEELIDMDCRFKYDILVKKIGYLCTMTKAADHELSHNELLNITIDNKEGVKQDLEVALYLIGTNLVDFKIYCVTFMPLKSLDEENVQLKLLVDNFDGTVKGLAFLFMKPVALQLHVEEAKQLIDAARGRCNNLWEITFEAFLDKKPQRAIISN
ncbi:hypothetical protein M0R45_038387 [Rubus argutus]|uniref:Uncharacterized protein n=1 Tax=Rubus argutus TaxID=59490 RepID=A0AAW1W730_RUBAR